MQDRKEMRDWQSTESDKNHKARRREVNWVIGGVLIAVVGIVASSIITVWAAFIERGGQPVISVTVPGAAVTIDGTPTQSTPDTAGSQTGSAPNRLPE